MAFATAKVMVPSELRTADWARVPLAIRERAFFSAAVGSARTLQVVKDTFLSGMKGIHPTRTRKDGSPLSYSPQEAIADIRQYLGVSGDSGKVTDFGSYRRQQLIQDFQTEQAYSYGRWKRDLEDPDILDEFPAQRFTRVEPRQVHRTTWWQRWGEAGSSVGWQGASMRQMVALKTSPIWSVFSRFGTPYPPFDFGSGMGLEDVDRETAETLGLIPEDWDPQAAGKKALQDFNANVEASVKGLDPATKSWLEKQLGDLGRITGDRIRLVSSFGSPRRVQGDWQPKESVVGRDNSLEGLSASAKRRIGKAESEIAAQPAEVGLIFDQTGRVAMRLRGQGSFIEVSNETAAKLKGAVFSHNHPVAAPPSLPDLANAFRYGLNELRVVHKDWLWVIKPADGSAFRADQRAGVVSAINKWIIELGDFPDNQQLHDWFIANAPAFGLNYVVKGRI